ncbi:MAG: HAD family phosphatase [Cyclobacteriaceae bacterium]|nr:HAD family phosphatase [Cyclobacteriaceae bacterium]
MDLSHIKAIIFDAEGVVVDTEILWDKSQDELLGRRALEYDREYLKPRMAGQTLLEGAELMVDYYQLDEKPAAIEKERKELIHDLFENEIHFIDGFVSFINMLNGSRLKKSIATAMNKTLMVKVEKKLRLQQFFGAHVYYIEDVGNKSKPEPDVFLYAAEKLGVKPSDCIVIEDAPHGIEAANKAGMISIGLVTTFSREHLQNADFIADDFENVLLFFKQSGIIL